MYIRLLDMVLNSPSVVTELLEKRTQIYSDRPFTATVNPYGHDYNFAFDERPQWLHVLLLVVGIFSFNPSHFQGFSEYHDRLAAAVTMFSRFVSAFWYTGGMVSFDVVLEVLHMPDRLPGSWIKHEVRVAREWGVKMVEEPYQYVRKRMQSKEDVSPSMVSDHVTRMEKLNDAHRSEYEKALKYTSSTAFLDKFSTNDVYARDGQGTPSIWKRAHAEIDAFGVGTGRLPKFDDRSSLPYVDAIVREALRWLPPVPLALLIVSEGAPHAATTADIYNGFYTPSGDTLLMGQLSLETFGQCLAMKLDTPNAEQFIPKRFPGCRYTGNASLWSAMVTMLATLDFNLAKDTDGKDIITFEAEYMNGIARVITEAPRVLHNLR
ncbi:cytochrome P450 [Boletus coccyginus]|nr:cytochrome P450 [Boletus coccyginus]